MQIFFIFFYSRWQSEKYSSKDHLIINAFCFFFVKVAMRSITTSPPPTMLGFFEFVIFKTLNIFNCKGIKVIEYDSIDTYEIFPLLPPRRLEFEGTPAYTSSVTASPLR